jgi:hypothetical protein
VKLVVYKAKDGFRWRCVADSGKIVSESGEVFEKRTYALQAAERFGPADAEIESRTDG